MPTNAGIHCPERAIRVINLETGEVKAPKGEEKKEPASDTESQTTEKEGEQSD